MPTVLRKWSYRFFFWLNPVRLQESGGFTPAELNRIARVVETNQYSLLDAWNDFFGD